MRAGIPTGLALNTPISLARKQELQQLAWKDGTGRTAGIQVQHQHVLYFIYKIIITIIKYNF